MNVLRTVYRFVHKHCFYKTVCVNICMLMIYTDILFLMQEWFYKQFVNLHEMWQFSL